MSPNLAEPEIKSIGAWEEFFQWTSNHSIVVVGFERKTSPEANCRLYCLLLRGTVRFLFSCFFLGVFLVWEGDAHNAAAVAWLKEGKAVDDSSDSSSTARNFNITANVFIICISTCFLALLGR